MPLAFRPVSSQETHTLITFFGGSPQSRDLEYSLDDLLRALLNTPLYEKPEIGANPFTPLDGARPDRMSDGVKEVMKAIAKCYEGKSTDYFWFKDLVRIISMHRLTLDHYLAAAVEQGLLSWNGTNSLGITDEGRSYLVSHGIIEI